MIEGFVANEPLYNVFLSSAEGKISAVFTSGIYFTLNDRLLMLHDQSYGSLPVGIALRGIDGCCKELGLEAGMPVVANRGVLKSNSFELKINLQKSVNSEISIEFSRLSDFARNAEKLLSQSGRSSLHVYSGANISSISKDSIEDIFARAAYKGLIEMEESLGDGDSARLELALTQLVGLGRGLTPSLDDFLCGVIFLLYYSEKRWGIKTASLKYIEFLVKKIVPLRTNIYSAAYLSAAAAGEDFSIMRFCIENNGEDEMRKSIYRLLNVGGSSGADMLCGMCFAANYILKQRKFTF